MEERVHDHRADLRRLPDEALDRDEPPEVFRAQVPDLDPGVPRHALDAEVDLDGLLRGRDDPPDRLLPRREHVQGLPQEMDRHVRVEPVQVLEADLEGPLLRVPVREPDDLGLQAHLGEELLPAGDEFLERVLCERPIPPLGPPGNRLAREGRLVTYHLLLIRPPRRFVSNGFLWSGARVSTGSPRITRTWSRRTSRMRCTHPDGRASPRTPGSAPSRNPHQGRPRAASARRCRRSSGRGGRSAFKRPRGGGDRKCLSHPPRRPVTFISAPQHPRARDGLSSAAVDEVVLQNSQVNLRLNEIQLLLSEKRTSLSALQAGIAHEREWVAYWRKLAKKAPNRAG